MRRFFWGALAFVLAGTFQVVAQSASSTTGTGRPLSPLGVRQAPIGHLQPTAESVKRAKAERGEKKDRAKPAQSNVDIGKDLTICRGC
jgi:hypothetical protein